MKLVAAFLALGLVGAAQPLFAADAPAGGGAAPAAGGGGDGNTSHKAQTVYELDGDKVGGVLQRPDGELVNALKKTEHSSLIEIRKDFIPEMLKSLEDI